MPSSESNLICKIGRRARLFLGTVDREEWLQLQRIIDSIVDDPSVDFVTKFPLPQLPIVRRFYYEYPFRVIYRPAPPYLFIDLIERADFVPNADDWDQWWSGG